MIKTKSSPVLRKAMPCLSRLNILFPNIISPILQKLCNLCQYRIELGHNGPNTLTPFKTKKSVKNIKIAKKRQKIRKSDLPLPRAVVVFGLLLRHFEVTKFSCRSAAELYFAASASAVEKALTIAALVNGAAFSSQMSEFVLCDSVLKDALKVSEQSESIKTAILKAFLELVKIEGAAGFNNFMCFRYISSN